MIQDANDYRYGSVDKIDIAKSGVGWRGSWGSFRSVEMT